MGDDDVTEVHEPTDKQLLKINGRLHTDEVPLLRKDIDANERYVLWAGFDYSGDLRTTRVYEYPDRPDDYPGVVVRVDSYTESLDEYRQRWWNGAGKFQDRDEYEVVPNE